jgi:type I restriction enzyme M protein
MKSKPRQAPLFDSMLRLDADNAEAFSFGDDMREETEVPGAVDFAERRKTNAPTSSMQTNLRLVQQQLNDLHEELYRKGGIKPSNAAIDEVGKLIFLKVHAEQYPGYQLQSGAGKSKLFLNIFDAAYVRHNGKKAVRELQDAFQEISVLPNYLSEFNSDSQTLFPYREPLRLEHPDVLAMAIDILTPLSLSLSDDHLIANAQQQWETFSHQDLLGSAYDVFLRGKYDSSGGLGTYLTPGQVVDCMVKMAFSHISDEQLWAIRDDLDERLRPDNRQASALPAFLMGDVCCGTGRFLIRSLAEVRNRILSSPDKSNDEKLGWLAQMKKHSFFGADQSAASIIKARINFLLFGEPHA